MQGILGYDPWWQDGPPNRRGWAEKSGTAARREKEAIAFFDAFFADASSLPQNLQFPLTRQVVPATTHLTTVCWKSFRKHVISKGCTARRREATLEERSNDHRKSKMYVINVTIPVHPSKIQEYANEKKEKAAVATAQRKAREAIRAKQQAEIDKQAELAKQQAAQKAADEKAKWERLQTEYQSILNQSAAKPPAQTSAAASLPGAATPPTKKPRLSWSPSAQVSSQDMLKHADEVYQQRAKEISQSIQKEQRQMEAMLNAKKVQLETQAAQACSQVKQTVMASMPSSQTCDICKRQHRILAAKCIGDKCDAHVCMDCLKRKVQDCFKCVVCSELSRRSSRKYPMAAKPTKTATESFKCASCVKKEPSYYQFDYCRNGCGFICPEHTHSEDCCVCGFTEFCTDCTIDKCGRCGKDLCERCERKEGCMCIETSRYGRGGFYIY